MSDIDGLPKLSSLCCDADFWSLRIVEERAANYSVRKNVAQPPSFLVDRGAMLTVYADGGCGYAATSDLSRTGLAGRARSRIGVGAGQRIALADRFSCPAPCRAARRIRLARCRREVLVAPRMVRPPRRGVSRRRIRLAHRRLGSQRRSARRATCLPHQRRRRSSPALPVRHAQSFGQCPCRRRYPDPDAQWLSWTGSAGRRVDSRPVRLPGQRTAHRRRGAAAAGRAQLPDAERWTCC